MRSAPSRRVSRISAPTAIYLAKTCGEGMPKRFRWPTENTAKLGRTAATNAAVEEVLLPW